MLNRNILSWVFILIGTVLCVLSFLDLHFPIGLEGYFKRSYYRQFGPLAISIELGVAGFYLLRKHAKTNFMLALFAFTALLDPAFNSIGLFTSIVPTYALILFIVCALISIWIAFWNPFKLKKLSILGAVFSFLIGSFIELWFNYLIA